MHTFVTFRSAACLTLLVTGGLLAGLSQNAVADPVSAPVAKAAPVSAFQSFAPVVKLGSAMLQEQTLFSDGSVHRQTYIDQQSAQSVHAVKTSPLVKDKPKAQGA